METGAAKFALRISGFSVKSMTAASWKSPMMAWSTVCDDHFRVADNSPKM
jgi:hypothetical protein